MPVQAAPTATVTLAWDDKNLESNLSGYKIYYGTLSKNYLNVIDVKKFTSCDISGLEQGTTYYFAATAYDDNNNESDFSEEFNYTIPIPPPADTDGDGISDNDEINIYETDPNKADTDEDGMNDGDELAFWGDDWSDDSDNDGLVNLVDPDSDGDGFNDGSEVSDGYDPSDSSSHFSEKALDFYFDYNEDGFSYDPDTFNNTANPNFSTGSFEQNGGRSGGGLRVFLGPGSTGGATSGGWSQDFSVGQDVTAQVTLSFRLIMDQGYEANEFGEVILEIDGIRHGNDVNNSLVHAIGNGTVGGIDDTGWLTESFSVPLSAGNHTLVIGAYNNNATYYDESVEVLIDDVIIVAIPDTLP